jgi:DNA-binding NarL/FixJ family response regulator
VIVAADGEEAIRLLTSSREHVDLVILDLIMPRMSGRDALLALRALRPSLPILVSTGVQLDAQALGTRGIPISGVLNKPYDFTDLAIAVRLAIDNAPGPRTTGGGASA